MTHTLRPSTLPNSVGIGLKFQHIDQFIQQQPDIGFVEVHAENYMVEGGLRLAQLEAVRQDYPLSIHGVAASLGGDSDLSKDHLRRLKRLVDRFQPAQFSEHLAWSTHAGIYYNDLLPVPYTQERLMRVLEHVDRLQTVLGRQVLIENPASYIAYSTSEMDESEFVRLLITHGGCGLLLDINNLVVSCTNQNLDPLVYLQDLPLASVGEVHLAGFAEELDADGERLLIDSHASEVAPEVWQIFQQAIEKVGPKPTLLERDGAIPSLEALLTEARQAEPYLKRGECQELHHVG